MRVLLKFDMSLEAGNEAVCSGKIAELNHSLMERIQPEAAYCSTENGKRISYIFFPCVFGVLAMESEPVDPRL